MKAFVAHSVANSASGTAPSVVNAIGSTSRSTTIPGPDDPMIDESCIISSSRNGFSGIRRRSSAS
ncbi:hypothetical protein D3C83_318940 [compost metagenome]